ncbi:sulfotransferase family 2 domain-containing protein [Caballeronia sp. LZ035]|uniref:sulfotransferase family 2 domain-containing protein n=1 Tax=Caballeronia sp. LZ035 TaxID=3038568 RepID=UPI00285E51C3|nr:sulfotransferase family 2 domain-containing protein [Caballeronia sp. LZ035]MDR5757954.1 sulfotransferase family 2 domain-containing protein [Caballeronia sp. LZ035]
MRSVIIHYHLFKNAGSTIDGILSRHFSDAEHGHIEGEHPWSTVSPSDLLAFVTAHGELRAVSSHQARLPLPQDRGINFLPILFLRHPLDRFASVYEFERRQSVDSTSPSVAIARSGGLREFAEWTVSRDATAVCRNFQVIHLAGLQGDMRHARATHDDYIRALCVLAGLPFFGLVEAFDESLAIMRTALKPVISELQSQFVIENSSPRRSGSLEERVAKIENELGTPLFRELTEVNALDMLLYETARRKFRTLVSQFSANTTGELAA